MTEAEAQRWVGKKCRVRYPYNRKFEDELELITGDVIEVVKSPRGGWWEGKNREGFVGWFPAAFVEMPSPPPAAIASASSAPSLANTSGRQGGSTSTALGKDIAATSARPGQNRQQLRPNEQMHSKVSYHK